MRGRKPTPVALKLIRGNPGRRPVPENDFRPQIKCPSCPRHIKGEARREWRRLTRLLGVVICEVDRGALAMLCTCWATYVEANEKIAEDDGGMFIKSQRGHPTQSPWLLVRNQAIQMYGKLCVEFGLTPSSRTRIHMDTPPAAAKETNGGWWQFS